MIGLSGGFIAFAQYNENQDAECRFSTKTDKVYFYLHFVGFAVVPTIILIAIYVFILREIKEVSLKV